MNTQTAGKGKNTALSAISRDKMDVLQRPLAHVGMFPPPSNFIVTTPYRLTYNFIP
jgi:hypothetical protein